MRITPSWHSTSASAINSPDLAGRNVSSQPEPQEGYHHPNTSMPAVTPTPPPRNRGVGMESNHPPLVRPTSTHSSRPEGLPNGHSAMQPGLRYYQQHQHPANRNQKVQASEEFERGLRIDFYAIENPLLSASWASYFRDQCIILMGGAHSRHRHPVSNPFGNQAISLGTGVQPAYVPAPMRTMETASSRVEYLMQKLHSNNHVVKSAAVERVFSNFPFSNEKDFFAAFFHASLNELMRLPPYDSQAFDTPQWMDYMCNYHMFQRLATSSRAVYLDQYAKEISSATARYERLHPQRANLLMEALLEMGSANPEFQQEEHQKELKDDFFAFLGSRISTLSNARKEMGANTDRFTRSERGKLTFSVPGEAFVLEAVLTCLQSGRSDRASDEKESAQGYHRPNHSLWNEARAKQLEKTIGLLKQEEVTAAANSSQNPNGPWVPDGSGYGVARPHATSPIQEQPPNSDSKKRKQTNLATSENGVQKRSKKDCASRTVRSKKGMSGSPLIFEEAYRDLADEEERTERGRGRQYPSPSYGYEARHLSWGDS